MCSSPCALVNSSGLTMGKSLLEASSRRAPRRLAGAHRGVGRWPSKIWHAGIAYLDPGNLESQLQAGAQAGYDLIWVLLWVIIMVCP